MGTSTVVLTCLQADVVVHGVNLVAAQRGGAVTHAGVVIDSVSCLLCAAGQENGLDTPSKPSNTMSAGGETWVEVGAVCLQQQLHMCSMGVRRACRVGCADRHIMTRCSRCPRAQQSSWHPLSNPSWSQRSLPVLP